MPKNKDPAVLFYPSDFLSSTILWSDAEIGMYIKLLCLQFLQDGVSEDDLDTVCGDNKRVRNKFDRESDGLYRNQRMKAEKSKRSQYTESRRANANRRTEKSICNTYGKHMPSICNASAEHMENENRNKNINVNSNSKKVVKHKHGMYNNILLTDDELEKLKAEYPDWSERIDRLSEYVASSGKSYKSHYATIRAWARREAKSETVGNAAKYNAFDTDAAFLEAVNRTYKGGEDDG
jgi:hypothetical protein